MVHLKTRTLVLATQPPRARTLLVAAAAAACLLFAVAQLSGTHLLRRPYLSLSTPAPFVRAASATATSAASCEPRHPLVLVYNRSPNAGSTTMAELLRRLAERNGFKHVPLEGPFVPFADVRAAIEDALRVPERSAIEGHFNFPEVLDPRVAYINVVREPVDRCVSYFYFHKYHHPDFLADVKTIDACVSRGHQRCCSTEKHATHPAVQARFFCGSDNRKACPSHLDVLAPGLEESDVLSRALANMDAHYAVVGLTEHLATTVAVLERVLPDFFRGAGKVFTTVKRQKPGSSGMLYTYVHPSNATRVSLSAETVHDTRLYAHARETFWALRARCRLGDVS